MPRKDFRKTVFCEPTETFVSRIIYLRFTYMKTKTKSADSTTSQRRRRLDDSKFFILLCCFDHFSYKYQIHPIQN